MSRPVNILTHQHLSIVALLANGVTLRNIANVTMIPYPTVRRRLEEAKVYTETDSIPSLVAKCVHDGAIVRGAQGFVPNVDPTALD